MLNAHTKIFSNRISLPCACSEMFLAKYVRSLMTANCEAFKLKISWNNVRWLAVLAALCIYSAIKCQNHFYHWTLRAISSRGKCWERFQEKKGKTALISCIEIATTTKKLFSANDTKSIDRHKLIYGIFISCDCLGCYTCNLLSDLSFLLFGEFCSFLPFSRVQEIVNRLSYDFIETFNVKLECRCFYKCVVFVFKFYKLKLSFNAIVCAHQFVYFNVWSSLKSSID